MLRGKGFSFEKILDSSTNTVTFSLYNAEEDWRLAYGFFKNLFPGTG